MFFFNFYSSFSFYLCCLFFNVFLHFWSIERFSLRKKWSFSLRISSVNVTKFESCCRLGHIYWRNPEWKATFFVHCFIQTRPFILLPSLGRSGLTSIDRSWFSRSSCNRVTSQDWNTSTVAEIVTDFNLVTISLFFM